MVPTHQRGMVDTKKVTEEKLVETTQEDDQIEQSIDDVAINVEADDKEPLLKWCDKKSRFQKYVIIFDDLFFTHVC